MEFIRLANDNPIFVFIISIAGLVGFLITIYLFFKTKNISKTLRNISIAKNFNKERNQSIERLKGFATNFIEDLDNISLSTLRYDLHCELNILRSKYKTLFSFNERYKIFVFIQMVSRKKLDLNKTVLYINNTIAILSNKKEGL